MVGSSICVSKAQRIVLHPLLIVAYSSVAPLQAGRKLMLVVFNHFQHCSGGDERGDDVCDDTVR